MSLDHDIALNNALDDLISLLEREVERLQESLEIYRLSQHHPERHRIVRWHILALDERQDALEEMKARLLAPRALDGRR
jgi:hypothetical protein